MRRIFLTWLVAVTCSVVALTLTAAYAHFIRHAEEQAGEMMDARLDDLMELIRHSEDSTRHVMEVNDAGNIQRARALAELLRLNPALLKDQEALQGVCNELGAAQLAVADERGMVQAAVPASHVGDSLADSDNTRAFLACIEDPDAELSLRPQLSSGEKEMVQYAGVHRRDARGVVMLGMLTAHEQELRANASFGKLAANYHLGERGRIVAIRDGLVLNPDTVPLSETELLGLPLEKTAELNLNNEAFIAYATEYKGFRLVGLLPLREIADRALKLLGTVLVSDAVLFLLVVAVAAVLLQVYVLRNLQRVNGSLRRIGGGDLTERVSVGGTPEMVRLSTDLNAMVDALQSYAEEKRRSMKEALDLARSMQMAAMPGKFPAFPHREEFDLYALCQPALTVGGDFYDFFLIDADHLGFLLGDSSENGIPAALYMMRCMSAVRATARTGATPAEVMAETNRMLTEMDAGRMHMSLFYGCLEISSGLLRYVNAGEPQLMLQPQGGSFAPVPLQSGMVLGVYDAARYTESTLHLQAGDRLFLYSAGVPKAADAENAPFGKERLAEALNAPAARISDVPLQVRSALRRFMQTAEQREDITMFALEFRGERRAFSSLSFRVAEAAGLDDMLEEQLQAVFASVTDIEDMKACAHSVLNAMEPDGTVKVSLSCTEREAELSFLYAGPRRNPMVGLPHLPVNDVRYSYGDENVLTLRKLLV